MECIACCSAGSYQLKEFLQLQKTENSEYTIKKIEDVLYLSLDSVHIFYFPYGAFVLWREGENNPLLKAHTLIKPYEDHSLATNIQELFSFEYGSKKRIHNDLITLADHKLLTKLAISHGLAQSVKLSAFEKSVQKKIDETKTIPKELAQFGKIAMGKKEICRKMGELFLEKSSINLHADLLDTPSFFWNYDELEPYYVMSAHYLDLESRTSVLNQKLEIIHNLFEMLENQLDHRQSARLEWAIIWLILIEVILTLMIDVFHIV